MSDDSDDLQARRHRALGPTYQTFYEEPVHFVRGEGTWLYDPAGNAYLDAYNNVVSVGHCHPHVVAALARQAATLNTHTRYLHGGIVAYAERLLAKVPGHLGHALFTCTGSEANDLAIRIAEHATGGKGIVITSFAYHGATVATTALSPSAGSPLGAGHRTIPAPNTFEAGGRNAKDFIPNLTRALDAMVASGVKPAALLIDSAFSSDGIYFPEPALIAGAGDVIRAYGGLLIADEVQPGFGRLGTGMWGFGHYGLVPDIVTLGKPMGDGHPMGGVLLRPEFVRGFGSIEGYFNTFGGNPVVAAVGMAVLDVIEAEGLVENARDVGVYLGEGLEAVRRRHAAIADVRGCGLYFGVEFGGDRPAAARALTKAVLNGMRRQRILIGSCGEGDNILKIRPPLPFSRANVDQLVESLDRVLVALA